jgi:serine protease Do
MKFCRWTRAGFAGACLALAFLSLAVVVRPVQSQPADPLAEPRASSATEEAQQVFDEAQAAERIRAEAEAEIRRQEAEKPPLEKLFPTSIEDLKAIQVAVQELLPKVYPSTVSLQVGSSQGSGVIISADGYVLTAGHVIGEPGQQVNVILDDGREVRGESLGVDTNEDAGLVKILDPGPWPHVEMAGGEDVRLGQWVVSVGHPGGYDENRGLVMRLGRVLDVAPEAICTDCTLVGGDSGGPLFNIDGKVIGIHSRIGRTLTDNYHVPIKTFHTDWTRLVAAEHWGDDVIQIPAMEQRPMLGLSGNFLGSVCLVRQVHPNSAAAMAGIQVNDRIASIDGEEVGNFIDVAVVMENKKPNDTIRLEILRGGEKLSLDVQLGGRVRSMPGGPPRRLGDEESSAPSDDRMQMESTFRAETDNRTLPDLWALAA